MTYAIAASDYHTAGEPFRIVTSGFPEIAGDTVAERRVYAQSHPEVDAVRQLLCHEPRGHADMYGAFVVPPDDDGAHFGVLFWHKDGYSTACGHGSIALGAWAARTGRVPVDPDGTTEVVIDVPSGRVRVRVTSINGEPTRIVFDNVPSYVLGRDVPVTIGVAGREQQVRCDISYGGAIYASVPAAALGLQVSAEHYDELVTAGRAVKHALNATKWAEHPDDARLNGVYGTIIYDDLGTVSEGPHQRNVTVFADGEVDRSPCGSGTSARLALLAADGLIGPDRGVLVHDSIIGTRFIGRVVGERELAGRIAIDSEVEGMAYRTGEHVFVLDPADRLGNGFVLMSPPPAAT